VILCHGFGATGTDLVSLGPELLRLKPELSSSVRFFFPEAPLALDELGMHGSRAWWPLDVERLTAAIEQGELRDLRNETPPGLVEAREKLLALVEQIRESTGLETARVVFGGFSQGAMLTTDVALRLPERPAGLCIFSGTLLCQQEWRELVVRRGPLPVLQSHGRQDPLLPFPAAEQLCELMTEAGMPVQFIPFDGPHTIPFAAIEQLAAFLRGFVS
jgi:phospholipase/carboxylesterase